MINPKGMIKRSTIQKYLLSKVYNVVMHEVPFTQKSLSKHALFCWSTLYICV